MAQDSRGIHYSTPAILLSSLLCGVAFAVGHHLFYSSLDGRPASTDSMFLHVSHQRFNLAVGNTFAFAVKVCLTVAISTAYFQAFWRTTRRSKDGQRLSTLDTMFSILENAVGFWRANLWYRHPLLLCLAIISWCTPLASIVTPSTLTVQSVLRDPPLSSILTVPTLDFASLDYLVPPIYSTGEYGYVGYGYGGPSEAVSRVASTVGLGGQILPITPPSGNTHWTLKFWGPALSCGEPSSEEQKNIWLNWLEMIDVEETAKEESCYVLPTFAAWSATNTSYVPFGPQQFNNFTIGSNTLSYDTDSALFVAVIPWTGKDFARICFSANSVYDQIHDKPQSAKVPFIGELFGSATLLKCQVSNASYTTDFQYTNSTQTVDVNLQDSGQQLVALRSFTGPTPASPNSSTAAGNSSSSTCSTLNSRGQQCVFDIGTLHTLSFQAVADAFGALLVGLVEISNPNVQHIVFWGNSLVRRTLFMDTHELAFLGDYMQKSYELDQVLNQGLSGDSDYQGLRKTPSQIGSHGSLKDTLESTFTNITISLMSDPYLQPNYSSKFAPPPTNVTFITYQNVYSYSQPTLLIAYGSAIATAGVAIIVGLVIVYLNGASYDNNFSTVLRVSKTAYIKEDLIDIDDDGRRLLPKALAHSKLTMRVASNKREAVSLLSFRSEKTNNEN